MLGNLYKYFGDFPEMQMLVCLLVSFSISSAEYEMSEFHNIEKGGKVWHDCSRMMGLVLNQILPRNSVIRHF